jgi:hypothetical protein
LEASHDDLLVIPLSHFTNQKFKGQVVRIIRNGWEKTKKKYSYSHGRSRGI